MRYYGAVTLCSKLSILLVTALSFAPSSPAAAKVKGAPAPAPATWMKAYEGLDIPVIVWDRTASLKYANQKALRFLGIDLRRAAGLHPEDMRRFVKPYMVNYAAWAREQDVRNKEARSGRLYSTARVPMRMNARHVFGARDWYLTSKPLTMDGGRFLITSLAPAAERK